MRRAGLTTLLVLLVGTQLLAGDASAARRGSYAPPAGDYAPLWSPDGSELAFVSGYESNVRLVRPDGADIARISDARGLAFSPDSTRIAFVAGSAASAALVVAAADGSNPRGLVEPVAELPVAWTTRQTILFLAPSGTGLRLGTIRPDGSGLSWFPPGVGGVASPDGSRLISSTSTDTTQALHVVRADGTIERTIEIAAAPDRFQPQPGWSPDGSRILYLAPEGGVAHLHVAALHGPGGRDLTAGVRADVATPLWSPDSRRIAFVVDSRPRRIGVANLAGSYRILPHAARAFPSIGPWSPRGDTLLYADPSGRLGAPWGADPVASAPRLYSLDVTSGARRSLGFGGGAGSLAFSPDGRSLAMAAGGECRDLVGIYLMRRDGSERRRLTRDCRVLGTDGNDVLDATTVPGSADPAYILLGLGGDDRLTAKDPGYVGTTLVGGPGDDVLTGGYRADLLEGGPGDDSILGGMSGDAIVGGPGRDILDGERGRDVIFAADGQADTVTCGTNGPHSGNPERDEVFADRFDVVAPDCEVVHGAARRAAPKAQLRITVWPQGRDAGSTRVRTLRCAPAGGTLPNPGLACRRLAALDRPFAPVPKDVFCTQIYGGPQEALVTGTYAGAKVWARFNRRDGCQTDRWNRVAFLF